MIKSPSRFFLQATWICHANFLCFHEILKFLLILSLEDLEPHLSVMARNVFPAAAAAKSLQSCPTLCDPIDRSPPGSSIPGILQARILEWVAISFSNAWKWKVKVKSLSSLTPSDPMDCSPPGPSVHGIFQARVLEWGAIAFFSEWPKEPLKLISLTFSQSCFPSSFTDFRN